MNVFVPQIYGMKILLEFIATLTQVKRLAHHLMNINLI